MKKLAFIFIFVLLLPRTEALACSSFYYHSEPKLLAKNFDWFAGDGYIIKNPRGQQKYAYGFHGDNVAHWTSRYGSITFNQIGKEFPYGGINEKGLVIEQLWLERSRYGDNAGPEISELEWIQYQLDNYSTVDEVIEHVNDLTIVNISTVHYMLADRTGTSAVIEFIDGRARIDRQQGIHQVITNEPSAESREYHRVNGAVDPESRTHHDRYCILSDNLGGEKMKPLDAFGKLDMVSETGEGFRTFWSIVYDIDNLEIYFRTYDHRDIRKISLADFDFGSAAEFSPVDSCVFAEYTAEDNMRLLHAAMKMMRLVIDEPSANRHQMNPDKIVVDKVYMKQ